MKKHLIQSNKFNFIKQSQEANPFQKLYVQTELGSILSCLLDKAPSSFKLKKIIPFKQI